MRPHWLASLTCPTTKRIGGDRWRFDFESDKSDPDTGQKYTVSQFTGQILSPKSNLCKLLGWMTGQTLSELEADAPDIDNFVGRRFELTISHDENSFVGLTTVAPTVIIPVKALNNEGNTKPGFKNARGEILKVKHHFVDLGFCFTDFKVQGLTFKK